MRCGRLTPKTVDVFRSSRSRAYSEGDGLSIHSWKFAQYPAPVIIPLLSSPGFSGDLADARGIGRG